MNSLRIGVLGTGGIVRAAVPGMRRARGCDVTAIASRSLFRARDAATRLGIEQALGSYEALLACDDVDAVYIALPNHLHAPLTVAAAVSGKHVLCEKPLAMTSVEAAEMVEACRRSGVVLMEALMYRFHPLWTTAIGLVADQAIGPVRWVDVSFSYRNDEPTDIRNVADFGGGALMDVGCYCVDVARTLFDREPVSVSAVAR